MHFKKRQPLTLLGAHKKRKLLTETKKKNRKATIKCNAPRRPVHGFHLTMLVRLKRRSLKKKGNSYSEKEWMIGGEDSNGQRKRKKKGEKTKIKDNLMKQ